MAGVSSKGHRAPDGPARGLPDTVSRFQERRRRWGAEAGRTLVVAMTVAGMGWLVVVPAVGGFVVGHALDRRYSTGITFSAGLGLLGLVLGCSAAWRRIIRQREDDHG